MSEMVVKTKEYRDQVKKFKLLSHPTKKIMPDLECATFETTSTNSIPLKCQTKKQKQK